MAERREWWDDNLIDSVIEAIPMKYILRWGKVTGPEVYPVIAAIEDWQEETFVNDISTRMMLGELLDIIERVRNVCADQCFFAQALGADGLTNVVSVEAIYAALDGER